MTSLRIYATALCLTIIHTALTGNNTIPFQLAGKLIIVRAAVDGQPGNFILDTGIANLVLNNRYFNGRPMDRTFQGVSGQAGQLAVSEAEVRIGNRRWNKVYAEVIPMPVLENSKGIPIHGLLGTGLFRDYILVIDFRRLEIELIPPEEGGAARETEEWELPVEVLSFRSKGGTPVVTIQVGGETLALALDTGAEINLLAKKYERKLSSYLENAYRQRCGGFGPRPVEATIAQLSSFRTDKMICRAMKTAFVDLSRYNRYVPGPAADGIVGYEFLSQFRVGFNFRTREVYLWEGAGGLMAERK